jgi:hypothetical protein
MNSQITDLARAGKMWRTRGQGIRGRSVGRCDELPLSRSRVPRPSVPAQQSRTTQEVATVRECRRLGNAWLGVDGSISLVAVQCRWKPSGLALVGIDEFVEAEDDLRESRRVPTGRGPEGRQWRAFRRHDSSCGLVAGGRRIAASASSDVGRWTVEGESGRRVGRCRHRGRFLSRAGIDAPGEVTEAHERTCGLFINQQRLGSDGGRRAGRLG